MDSGSDSTKRFGFRSAQVIALTCLIGVAGCTDTTAPDGLGSTDSEGGSTSAPAEMVAVANRLDDMTSWWMYAIQDAEQRTTLQDWINSLKTNLSRGNVKACQQYVTSARSALSKLSEVEQVEASPIGVALDVVESALNSATAK